MLECTGVAPDAALLEAWRGRVERGRALLGWPPGEIRSRVHKGGASLALAAPDDQLYTATELNEWALLASAVELHPDFAGTAGAAFHAPGHPAYWDVELARRTLALHSRGESNPTLIALVQAAEARGLQVLIDEERLSIGAGKGAGAWPLDSLPMPSGVAWESLHEIPVALVTGSNGKTTTVRLVAAMARANGWHAAYSSTDGMRLDHEVLGQGDYSGPAGARTVLRNPRVDAAVLETARGGLLRRGIAPQRVRTAVVTNVSDDHFGEFGVDDLERLAEVKLTVAQAMEPGAELVVNADDEVLVRKARQLSCPIAWFALDADNPIVRAHRQGGGTTCGVRAGRMVLESHGRRHDLGSVADMPLTFGASADYNVANCAAASLAAFAMRVPARTIAAELARFGLRHDDNPGRLQHWKLGTLRVFVDYAHNPDGLRGLLEVAARVRGGGRLGLLLGQAGNRKDAEIRELATVAAGFHPDRVVLKDIAAMLRGRAVGEVPRLLRAALAGARVRDDAIDVCLDEKAAALELLAWARRGDVVVLPLHSTAARDDLTALLDRMAASAWQPGTPLPTA